jgi:malate synthase
MDRRSDSHVLQIRGDLERSYADVYTPEALAALAALAPLNEPRRALMSARIQRRAARARGRQRIAFLDPATTIPGTEIKVDSFWLVTVGVVMLRKST